MTDEAAPPPPPPAPEPPGMQFDLAESQQPAVSAVACSACKGELTDVYFLLAKNKICASCRDAFQKELEGGGKAARVIQAILLGLLAAVVGGAIWAYITYASDGTVYGIVAIGLGLLVGAAVRKATGGRGGRGYQFLAIGLTYLGVAIGYSGAMIPMALKGKSPAAERKAGKAGKEKPAAEKAAEEKAAEEKAEAPADPSDAPIKDSPGALAGGCLVALILLIGVFIGSPVLVAV